MSAYRDPHRVRVTAIASLSRLRASSSVSLQRPTLSNLNMHRPHNSATKSANGSEVQGLVVRRAFHPSDQPISDGGANAPRAPPSPLTTRPFSWKRSERSRSPVVRRRPYDLNSSNITTAGTSRSLRETASTRSSVMSRMTITPGRSTHSWICRSDVCSKRCFRDCWSCRSVNQS